MVVQAARLSGVLGCVVAGGRSVRMGRDKALLPWAGGTLLDHAVARLRAVTNEVCILCGPAPRYHDRGLPLVLDALPEAGPLAGLDAALGAANGRPVLLLGVDLPFVTLALLRFLADGLTGPDVVVPVLDGRPEPLCAAYGPACAAPVRDRLAAGVRKMTSFWPEVVVRELTEGELIPFGAPAVLFRNLNTPQDFDENAR